MHKARYFLIGLVFSLGCRDGILDGYQEDDMTYRQIAWESLSAEAQATVTHDWQEARVSKCTYYADQSEAVCVTFNTTDDPLLGPIIVFIDPDSLKVLGIGPRF